ncbi:MAG: ribbon-helix-helix domain-containing protein [Alphaproteobacteria bacterium]
MIDVSMLSHRTVLSRSHVLGSGDPAEIKKRSVVIAGHRTSISLENVFWESLRAIAQDRAMSVNQMVTEIDDARTGNLSSAIRTFVLLNAMRN